MAIHNYYQHPGGEDQVFHQESELLRGHGHQVAQITRHNDAIGGGSLKAGIQTIWNTTARRELAEEFRAIDADVAHFHNTFPILSPAAYYAARDAGAAVVQTLHNYRLICPGATLARQGSPCEECLQQGSYTPAIRHRCYRGSRAATAAVASMLQIHHTIGTYRGAVDLYIALSKFAREKFINAGLPAERIAVKPNFLSDPPLPGTGQGGYALFAGRLSEEKGLRTLAESWDQLGVPLTLKVAGSGPLENGVKWPRGCELLGWQSRDHMIRLIQDARVLIVPSTWYECAPMTIVEALACGTPVIASHLGSLPEFVTHRRTGLLFNPGDAKDLARQVRWAFDHPEEMQAMRENARREFEAKYTAERNYKMLIAIYEQALEHAHRRRKDAPAMNTVAARARGVAG